MADIVSYIQLSRWFPLSKTSTIDKTWFCAHVQEEFEDTKGAIRIRKSQMNRQHNGQKKKYKRTNNDLQRVNLSEAVNKCCERATKLIIIW